MRELKSILMEQYKNAYDAFNATGDEDFLVICNEILKELRDIKNQ